MTRDDWITRAKALLAEVEAEEAAELLATEPEAPVVVEAEVVEAEVVEADEEPASKTETRIATTDGPEYHSRAPTLRGGRWARWAPMLNGLEDGEAEPRLRGSARLLVKAHQMQERGIDHVLDKLEGMGDVRDRLPRVNRRSVWGRK